MEEYESSDGLAAREFKRLRNMIESVSIEKADLKALLQLCVDDMYSPSGKIKKKTVRKLMAACQKGIVDFPQ